MKQTYSRFVSVCQRKQNGKSSQLGRSSWAASLSLETDAHRCNHDNVVNQTTPVDAYPAGQSAYGCYDMLGNVWEWTASVFQGYEGFVSYPLVIPRFILMVNTGY